MFLGNLRVFTPNPIRTETAFIEERNGVLTVVQTDKRGAPPSKRTTEKRNVRSFGTVRLARQDTIMASEIQGIRAFGSETEFMQVQGEVMRRLAGPTGVMRDVEITWENLRLGGVQGIVLDADGSTIINWFTEFGIAQPTEVDFDLDNAAPAPGAVRRKCTQVTRAMMRASQGAWVEGSTYALALAGDNFWDDLTAHSEVRETYLNTVQAQELRSGLAFETFRYGGVQWINYRSTDDGGTNPTVGVNTDSAKFLPVNAPGVFEMVFSPGEQLDVVNTPGRPIYPLIVPDRDRNMKVDIEVYSYPLPVCTRPGMLQRARRT